MQNEWMNRAKYLAAMLIASSVTVTISFHDLLITIGR